MRKTELTEQLQLFARNHGKIPSSNDYKKFPGEVYPHSVYKKHFGSFNQAMIEAGLPTHSRKITYIKCEYCESPIEKRQQKRFCNQQCYGLSRRKYACVSDRRKQVNITQRNKIGTRCCTFCNNDYLPHSKHGKYCSTACQVNERNKLSYERYIAGELVSSVAHRRHLTAMHGYQCAECSISEWRGKPLTLEVDHIDGNPDNNMPDNLRLLCLHCHSQTPTYRVKNSGNFKSDRRSLSRRKRYHRDIEKT